MFVGEIMSKELITITPEKKISAAFKLLVKHNVRHIPVVDQKDPKKLVGFISDRDVKENINFIDDHSQKFRPVSIKEIMQKNVSTVNSKTFIQDAAKIIYANKIGGLPVVDNGKLSGMISYHDIVGVFIEIMDVLQKSARIDVRMENVDDVDEIKDLLEAEGCEIIGIGLVPGSENEGIYSFRIKHRETQPLSELLYKSGYKVVEHFS